MDVLGTKLLPRQPGLDGEGGVDSQEMDMFMLAIPLTIEEGETVLPSPNMGTDIYMLQSKFFIEFTAQRGEMVFTGVQATTR